MKYLKILFAVFIISIAFGCSKKLTVNLSDEYSKSNMSIVNREISIFQGDVSAVELNAQIGDGLALIEELEFSEGEIKIELLGENNPGKSFIGIAFNIENDSTYEAIYFRPFNFVAEEKIRKEHMVQYIYHPEFTWRKLRQERTGEFENEILTPPNPDDWFKAKIIINNETVRVFVNESKIAALEINRLSTPKSKKIGLWTGFNSSGRFRNLQIKSF